MECDRDAAFYSEIDWHLETARMALIQRAFLDMTNSHDCSTRGLVMSPPEELDSSELSDSSSDEEHEMNGKKK